MFFFSLCKLKGLGKSQGGNIVGNWNWDSRLLCVCVCVWGNWRSWSRKTFELQSERRQGNNKQTHTLTRTYIQRLMLGVSTWGYVWLKEQNVCFAPVPVRVCACDAGGVVSLLYIAHIECRYKQTKKVSVRVFVCRCASVCTHNAGAVNGNIYSKIN